MSWTLDSSGTLTADGTEQTLATPATDATYVLKVDLSNMINGDVVELRVYTKVLAGSTEHEAWKASFSGIQINPVVFSPFVASDVECKFTLKETPTGSHHTYDWGVLRQ